jgi:hypothetical protein
MRFVQARADHALVLPAGTPDNTGPDTFGLAVVPQEPAAGAGAAVLKLDDNLSLSTRYHRTPTGYVQGQAVDWGTKSNLFYVGINLSRDDGRHAAWVKFVRNNDAWTVGDSAWDPVAGRTLAVGSRPVDDPPAPRYLGTAFAGAPLSTTSFTRDGNLALHRWTNAATGEHGIEVRMHGPAAWLWWVRSDDTNQAVALPLRRILDVPPAGSERAPLPDGASVHARTTAGDGTVTSRGPLATATEMYCAFSVAGAQGGWFHLKRSVSFDGSGAVDLLDGANACTAIGGPEGYDVTSYDDVNQYTNRGTLYDDPVDLDGDGLADYENIYANSFPGGGPDGSYGWLLYPIGDSAFARNPDTGTSLFPVDSAAKLDANSTWVSDSTAHLILEVTHAGGFAFLTGITGDRRIGLRYPAADGMHYAWLDLTAFKGASGPFLPPTHAKVRAHANPWPGEAVQLGVLPPGPLRIERVAGGQIRVRRAATAAGQLQRQGLAPGAAWEPVPDVSGTEHLLPPGGDGMLYRLK